MRKINLVVAVSVSMFLLVPSGHTRDWPKWLGPDGNNATSSDSEKPLDLADFEEAWSTNVGAGYSAVTIANGKAYTMGHDLDSQETVYCFDAATGAEIWHHSYKAELLPRAHTGGPNATPTFVGGTLLTFSKDGQAFAFDAATGKIEWTAKLADSLDVEVPQWGFGTSPSIAKNHILASAGKVTALDLKTGKTSWVSTEDRPAGYTTPIAFERSGKGYVAALDGAGVSILNLADGSEVARSPFKSAFNLNATTPEILEEGNLVFISGNTSSEMLSFDGSTLTPVWSSKKIKNAMNNSVIHDGIIYGIDGKHGQRHSRFVAVRASDGERLWDKEEFGYGNVIGVGGELLALTESGELVTLARTPDAYQEISRSKILDDVCWTTPVFANGRIYVRNNVGKVICLTRK